MKLSLDGQTRHRRSRWQRCALSGGHWSLEVVGEQDRQIKLAGRACVLLCERALCPGEANAQPPVSSELIGGSGWDYAQQSAVPGFCWMQIIAGGGRLWFGGG